MGRFLAVYPADDSASTIAEDSHLKEAYKWDRKHKVQLFRQGARQAGLSSGRTLTSKC